jgi:serine protease Do
MDSRSTEVINRIKGNRLLSVLLITVTLTFGILIGTVISRGVRGESNLAPDASPVQMATPQQLSSAFAQVATQIEPSVVNINTESNIRARQQQPRNRRTPDRGDDFQDFFDRFFGGPEGEGPFGVPEGARQRSLGSGVVLDAKGYIVTNAHVVERADRIRVHLPNEPRTILHDAKVIGLDRETDLAVIKIEPRNPLKPARLGNSDSLQVGDWVLAIGSPFSLEQTVTAGIISSKGRTIDNARQFQQFLQTDAAINPGNSGGPLVNMNGEVVGINTAIFTQTFGSQGVGFAMPSKVVADVYNQLIGPGNRVVRGSIGVSFGAVPNPAVARVYGAEKGVLVASVTPGGPAESAGLKPEDVITAVDGKKVSSGDELVSEISSRKPGTKATLLYLRGGKEQTAAVTIADRSKLFGTAEDADEIADSRQEEGGRLGLSVRPVTAELADRLGLGSARGVVVQDVRPASFAEDIGLQRGMIILEVNRRAINHEEDFRKFVAGLKSGQDVVFLVRDGRTRDSGAIFLGGTLP